TVQPGRPLDGHLRPAARVGQERGVQLIDLASPAGVAARLVPPFERPGCRVRRETDPPQGTQGRALPAPAGVELTGAGLGVLVATVSPDVPQDSGRLAQL